MLARPQPDRDARNRPRAAWTGGSSGDAVNHARPLGSHSRGHTSSRKAPQAEAANLNPFPAAAGGARVSATLTAFALFQRMRGTWAGGRGRRRRTSLPAAGGLGARRCAPSPLRQGRLRGLVARRPTQARRDWQGTRQARGPRRWEGCARVEPGRRLSCARDPHSVRAFPANAWDLGRGKSKQPGRLRRPPAARYRSPLPPGGLRPLRCREAPQGVADGARSVNYCGWTKPLNARRNAPPINC
jgi:hypothetical protein